MVARAPSSTSSTCGASPTATAMASATSPGSESRLPYLASTRHRCHLVHARGTVRRWRTAATTSPTTERSTRLSAPSRKRSDSSPTRPHSGSGPSSTWSPIMFPTSTPGSRPRSPLLPAPPSERGSGSDPGRGPMTATRCPPAGHRTSPGRPGRGRPIPTARRASGTCTCSPRPSRTSTGTIRTSVANTRRSSGSGSIVASAGIRIDSAALLVKDPTPAGDPRRAGGRRASEHGPRRPARHLPELASHRRRLPGLADPGRRAVAARRRALREVPAAGRAPHGVQLRLHGPALGRVGDARLDRRDACCPRPGRRARDLAASPTTT